MSDLATVTKKTLLNKITVILKRNCTSIISYIRSSIHSPNRSFYKMLLLLFYSSKTLTLPERYVNKIFFNKKYIEYYLSLYNKDS